MAGILDELRAEVEREKALTPQKPKKKSALEELREEVGQEPRKESELERIRREVDVNPESLRARRAEGQKLTDEQQKIAFEAERSRGLWDMAKGYAKAFPGAAYDAAKKLVLGTKEYLQESAPALGSALATAKYSQMPTPENLAVAEELRKKQEAENARAWNAQRSAASGVATDIEETANAAVRAAFFGTSITDLAAEKLGIIAKEKSFNNYLARESMREQERQSVQEYPDRASFLLSESPLADVALDVGAALQGGTAQEQIDRADVAKKFYREGMLEQAASFKPNENISAAFENFSPISIPAKLVKPFTKLTTGTMETAGGLALRAVTKPTIKGVNPLEGVGLGINWVGDKSETFGKALSRAVTGTEDTAISGLISTPVKTATYLPGKILTGTGRTMRDLGRQIDAGGIRGRTGLLERLGRDPASADFLRDMFGPGSQKSAERLAKRNAKRLEAGKAPIEGKTGGIARARAADWTLRMANNLAQTGTSGAVLNGIIGAADLETAEEFGRATGTGFGIGAVMGANVPGRIEAAFDPTTSFAEKVDKILEINPEDRRRDEDADLVRFRATTDPAVKEKVDKIADPNGMIAARERELNDLFQLKAEADYREEDTAVLDQNITIKMDELNKLKQDIANLSPEELAERKRAVELIVLDAFDSLKTNGRAAGLNGVDIQILESSDFEPFLRAKWGKNLTDAEAIVAQLDGKADLSPSEIDTLGRAKATVQQFQRDVTEYSQQLGFGLSESGYDADTPAHLRMSNIGAPTLGINAEVLLRDPSRVGLRYLLQHEGQHVLENFKEVQELQRPIRELFFGRKRPTIDPATGQVVGEEIQPGIITDEWLDTTGVEVYGRKFGGVERFKSLFGGSLDRQREYLRKEVMADLSGLSESRYGSVRDALDSTGQALIDRVLVARKNSLLGRIRSALYSLGVEIDSNGGIQSLLFDEQLGLSPEALALMRQFKRAQRDLTDTLTYTTTGPENQVEIPITELMTNRGLQEAYKDDVIWEKEQVLAVFDDAGNQISEIVIPPGTADSALDEYRMRGGKLVDENGNELTLSPEINIQAIPDGSRVSIDTRIARNPDGSPKILSNKEIKARARQRNQMIRDAIDNAPDDDSGIRLRDTGNGSYRGTLSPTQLQAIMALPNDVVPPSLKRNTAVFNELLQKGDGSRVLMEYQPALRGGRYRALAPKIRDVVPIGFQFSKDGNFLATTISVSRMFDKMNAWAQKKPDNLNLWGRDLTRFWDDVRIVLDNHNRGFKAEGVDPKDGTMKGTPLDQDPEIALKKKNRINDFFNLFNKDTEGLNPDRTKLPVRRGQDSADRIIMSARMDRINQLQVSNSEKLPVDYGKMTVNFMPADQTMAEDLTDLDIENDMELEDEARGASAAQFLPGIRYTELPDDPKKLMADFYMLNAMLTTPPTGWNLGKFGGESTMYAPSKDPTGRYAGARAEVYEDALQQAKQTLIPRLHEKIQKALHFAVAAELRHALSRKQPTELASSEFWQEYARQYAVQGSSIPDLKKGRAPRRFKNESGGYQDSFVAMESARKKLGMSVADVARFAEQMFRTGAWSQSYGGTPWGDIAQHLAQMSDPNYSTERVRSVVTDENGRMQVVETDEFRNPGVYNQMFQEIDRAYDLQHNTNTVFNKIKKYSLGSEGYRWIAKMLDFKANIGNPRELQKYTSGTMRNLANAWLGDMRADAPTTQDLEERVKAQLPDKLVENLDPDQFIEVLKDRVGDFYRKRTSGVVREDPYESIRNEAENIYRKKHSGTPKNNEWNAIKKDQNAHIGIILDDHFGDIGIARTDAVKLFRMLLAEGKDPQVTGKTPPPKIEQPLVQGLKAMGPKEISNAADTVVSTSNMSPENSGADIGGYKVFLKKDKSGYFVLMAAPKTESGAIGSSFVLNWLKVKDVNNPTIKTKISEVLASFQKDVLKKEAGAGSVPTPASATPSSQYFIGQKFVPNKNKSVPTNLFEFAKEAMGVKGINGVQIGDITLVSAGANKANDVTFKVYQGDSVAEKDLIDTIVVPSPVADLDKNLADWLAEYAETKAEQAGYTSLMGWMAQDLSKSMKPEMPAKSKKIQNIIDGLPSAARQRVNQLLENLQDQEWVDTFLGDLPPSDIAASEKYVTDLVYGSAEGIEKAKIADAMSANDVTALGKYLYDVAKWASDKLEARKEAQMKEDDAAESAIDDDMIAPGYSDENGNPMTVAQVAAGIKPFEPGSNDNHVYFTTFDGTAITNPYEEETSDSIEEPPITELKKGHIMKYWANQGVGPAVSEAALAIFDKANPGHTYKPDTKLWNTEGLMDKIGTLGMTLDDVVYDMGVPSKIDVSTKNGEVTITKTGPGEYTYDVGPKNFAIGPLDSVLKAAAEYLKKPSQAADNDAKAQKQAMEFLNDMLLDEPVTIDGNTWELEGVWDGDEVTSAVVKLNGIPVSNQIPFEPETATPTLGPKGIYDEYFALDWMKDWNPPAAESKSLLSSQEETLLEAASTLVNEAMSSTVGNSEVQIGDKSFTVEIDENGKMVVFGKDKDGLITGAVPILGSKNMDQIDLESAVYEALDVLQAKVSKTPTAKMPTETELNEAADELLNAGDGDSVTVGGYEFQTVLGGQGGAAVNILPEGTRDIIDTFYYDASDFDNPSDLLDVLHINLKQFFQNNSDEGPSSGAAKFMPASPKLKTRSEILDILYQPKTGGTVAKTRPKYTYKEQGFESHDTYDYENKLIYWVYGTVLRNGSANDDWRGARIIKAGLPLKEYRKNPEATVKKYAPRPEEIEKLLTGLNSGKAVKIDSPAFKPFGDIVRYTPDDIEIFDRKGNLVALENSLSKRFHYNKGTPLDSAKEILRKHIKYDDKAAEKRRKKNIPVKQRWDEWIDSQNKQVVKNLKKQTGVLITEDGRYIPLEDFVSGNEIAAIPLPLTLHYFFEEAGVLDSFLPLSTETAAEEYGISRRDVDSTQIEKINGSIDEAWDKMKELGLTLVFTDNDNVYVGTSEVRSSDLKQNVRNSIKRFAEAHGVPVSNILKDNSFYEQETYDMNPELSAWLESGTLFVDKEDGTASIVDPASAIGKKKKGPGPTRFMPAGKFDTSSKILKDVARSRGLVAKRVKPSFEKFTSKYAPGRDMNYGRWASPRDGYMLYRYGVISRNGETDPDNGAFEWWIPVPFEKNGDLPSVETQKKYAPTRDQIDQKIAELNAKDYQDFEIFDEKDGTLYAVIPPYGFSYDQGKKTSLRDIKKELASVADDLDFDDEVNREEKTVRGGSKLPSADRWKNYLRDQDREARKKLESHDSVLISEDGKIIPVQMGGMPLPVQLQSIFEEAGVLREFLPNSVFNASEEFDVAERDVDSGLLEKNDEALNEAWKKMKSLGFVLARVNQEDLSMYVGSSKNRLDDLSPAARQAVKRLAMAHGVPDNAIVSDKSFYSATKWVDDSGNLPDFLEGDSDGGPARFMPAGEGISPKTLYNFYHLATLESQGRIKSEYGQGLMREYLDSYKQRYLDTLGPLVSDQIKKYIGRGRVDEGVTDEVLETAANDPALLDELMRQTYRSDMKRRNDVWNNITEHLKGLAEARTPKDIIFRIDRLNNAIHNTNELLFTKFKNAGELMDAFESIHNARDERAYARNVDRDLRQIEEFEGGSGPAGFMPAASKAAIVDRIVKGVKPENRLKGESAWLTPKGWVNVSDHLDIFPEDLAELRKVNYEDVKDRNFVRVRQMGKTLWYEGRPTRRMLKELKDTAVERRLKLEEDRVESYRSSGRFMPGDYALYGKKPFFIGVASLLDGKIEETHTAKEAENVDWHHTFLISAPVKERMESGESVLFWVDEDGKINLDSGQWWNEPIDPEDWRRILPEIQSQIKPNPRTSLPAQMMPSGSFQDGPSLADVPSPISNQGPLSGTSLGASFMPGYNPRYTKDDGSFDREAWLNDRRRAEAELRRRGLSRRDYGNDDEYEQAIRDLLREPTRG